MEKALNPTWNYISGCGFPLLINVVFLWNRRDGSQNGTFNAELSTITPESSESIQSKNTEPACVEFSVMYAGNSGQKASKNNPPSQS